MNTFASRTIYKRHDRAREEVRRLLTAVFAGEFIEPSNEVWLVSPWIRNVTILDNRAGDFAAVQPAWGQRDVGLVDCLSTVLARGAELRVKTSNDPASQSILRELERRARDLDASDRLWTRAAPLLHTKGLLTSRCAIRGSMNFTVRGVELTEEAISYDVDPVALAEMRIALADQW